MTSAEPALITRVVERGKTETREFVLRNPPNDTITATIAGDHTQIRLREMTACAERVVDADCIPDIELPPHLRGKKFPPGQDPHNHELIFDVVGHMDGEGSMPVRSDQDVSGVIEFEAAAAAAPGVVESVLQLRGETWDGLDVPIKMMTGAVVVDFGPDPVVAYQGQTVRVPVRISLPSGHPPTTLQLRGWQEAPNWQIDATVEATGGETVETKIAVSAATTAPLGEAEHQLNVSGWDNGLGAMNIPFTMATVPFSNVIRANEFIEFKAGDNVPTSATREASNGGFVRHYATGDIYYHESTDAHWVYGGILDEYLQQGGPAALGYPLNDESSAGGAWRFNNFERGSIYWSPQQGAKALRADGFGPGVERTDLGSGYHLVRSESAVRILSDDGNETDVQIPQDGLPPDKRDQVLNKMQSDIIKYFRDNKDKIASGKIKAVDIGAAAYGIGWLGVLSIPVFGPVVAGLDGLSQAIFGVGLSDLAVETGKYYGSIVDEVVKILKGTSDQSAADIIGTMAALYFTTLFPAAGVVRFFGVDGWSFTKDVGSTIGGALEDALRTIEEIPVVGDAVGVVADAADAVGGVIEDMADHFKDLF